MLRATWILGLFVLTLGLGACSSTEGSLGHSENRSTASQNDDEVVSFRPTSSDLSSLK